MRADASVRIEFTTPNPLLKQEGAKNLRAKAPSCFRRGLGVVEAHSSDRWLKCSS